MHILQYHPMVYFSAFHCNFFCIEACFITFFLSLAPIFLNGLCGLDEVVLSEMILLFYGSRVSPTIFLLYYYSILIPTAPRLQHCFYH